jgi:hypothetical protein
MQLRGMDTSMHSGANSVASDASNQWDYKRDYFAYIQHISSEMGRGE